ncbi:high frequency lysogenization protein HflD [Thiospirillum jenense]|uniref:High frequency lysogenization protein HflD homolog n=1 Tax=Thiospirillum jenense TaxID=1653858 RepID=A0A839HE22_9GAMM|nr:high frequency lysogenization protein HflD [Thiospirillum jenense]
MSSASTHSERDRLLAIAGLYQAAACVQAIARHGRIETAPMQPCIYSLFQFDPSDVPAVYEYAAAVRGGAQHLLDQLVSSPRDLELTRYAITLLKHAQQLSKRRDLLTRLRTELERIAAVCQHESSLLDDTCLAQLAALYSDTVGRLEPRILIHGQAVYLKQTDNQHAVRALLLTGVRAAILWYQLGGRRWHIIFARRRLYDAARAYLADTDTDPAAPPQLD